MASAGPADQLAPVQREAVPLPSLLADDPVTLDTVVVDGSVLRKNPAIVNANLAAAQEAWDRLSFTDRLFDHYGEGPSISRQLDLARADMREFNRWEDELPASTVINVLRNLDAYDAGKLDAPVGDVIRARGYIQMVNRYYMGDEPFVIGPPSQAEVAFATRNAVDLQLAMMGLSAMTAGHLTRWSGQSEERVLMAGQSARAMADIVTAAHIQSNGRAQPVSTMASVRRPRAGGVPNAAGPATNTIFVTRSGVAVPSGDLGRLGSSHLAGNFRGLEGASIDEIFARTPRDWTWAPQDRGAGIKLIDTQGYERIRIHGPSARAPVGSNSVSGWTMRIMDRAGNYYDNFGNVVPYRANSGHIPVHDNPVLGRTSP